MKRFTEVEITREMPVWVDETAPPADEWGVYTDLGPFKPNRLPAVTPFARRVEHAAAHAPRLRKSFTKWAKSMAREAGDFLVGAFQPVKEAW